ncbi:conserved Plasmodium protein, unknown function [Plasmodium gallinaceum]|uniref:Uncharacterized protein n=1 Tax=Plasmodium gallinaceum TaxID=5849 RepID=A0A1J1GUH2_PLAGA|nr:conserved Plasmodium protein, unknown function [Plasmodium gallinaceum]CRG94697.1 conserved Plasmodium protein, unknown function [Plasmodium gallinaceum]
MISHNNDFAGLNSLRTKNISEISELIKEAKENKKNLNIDCNEGENIEHLKIFAENQGNCFSICKNNLIKRFEKDIEEYKNFSYKNNININEENIKKLESDYKYLENQFCFYVCSKKYFHLLQDNK